MSRSATRTSGACVLALLCLTAVDVSAQNASANRELATRLENEAIKLLTTYPDADRQLLLPHIVPSLVMHGRPDSAIALLHRIRADVYQYAPVIQDMLARKDVKAIIGLSQSMNDSLKQLETIRSAIGQSTDTTLIFQLAAQLPKGDPRIYALQSTSRRFDDNRDLQLAIARRARDSVAFGLSPYRVAEWLGSMGDLSGLQLLTSRPTTEQDVSSFVLIVSRIGANRRVAGDRRADSVYAIALEKAQAANRDLVRNRSLDAYWQHYLPNESESDPLRHLSRIPGEQARTAYTYGSFAVALHAGDTAKAFRMADQLVQRGDTLLVVRLLSETFHRQVDSYGWQPLARHELMPVVARRALDIGKNASGSIPVENVRRMVAASPFAAEVLGDSVARTYRSERSENLSAYSTIDTLMKQRMYDSVIVVARSLLDSQLQMNVLKGVAIHMASNGNRSGALQLAGTFPEGRERDVAILRVLEANYQQSDRDSVRTIGARLLNELNARGNFAAIAKPLFTLMIRAGGRDEALALVRQQPESTRAFGLAALAIALRITQ